MQFISRRLLAIALIFAVMAMPALAHMEDEELEAQMQGSSLDNDPHDDNCNYRFPPNPLLGVYKDAVLFVKLGGGTTSQAGYRTALKGIFQDGTGATFLGMEIDGSTTNGDKTAWQSRMTTALNAPNNCALQLFTVYSEGRVDSGCVTNVPGVYQEVNGGTMLSAIPCNNTNGRAASGRSNDNEHDICQLGEHHPCNTHSNSSHSNSSHSNSSSHRPTTAPPSGSSTQYYYPTDNNDDDSNPDQDFTVEGNSYNYKVHKGGKISNTEFQMTFEVTGKGGAGIAFKLSKNQTDSNAIEVLIGDAGDTRSIIRIGTGDEGVVKATSNVDNVLSEDEPKAFWIMLDHGKMSVGQGHTYGALTLIPATEVPILGDKGWVWIGWSGGLTRMTYSYRGPTVSCLNVNPHPHFPTPTPTPMPPPRPKNCVVSDYVIPNATVISAGCSTTCGGGTYTVTRTIITEPAYGGSACPELSKNLDCNTDQCEPKCQVGQWGSWSECTKQCGGGTRSRSRTINADPNAYNCPTDLTQEEECNTECCPVDCVQSQWGPWEACSTQCGGGIQLRHRTTTVQPECGGQSCGSTVDQQACNTNMCPPICEVSAWSDFTNCSVTCGGGTRTATRTISGSGKDTEGYDCPDPSDTLKTESCNSNACPVDCVVGNWQQTSECSATCGGGYYSMERSILIQPQNGGKECPSLSSQIECNTQSCPPICAVDDWTEWSTCTQTCGGGTQYQTRTSAVKFKVSGNGGKYTRFGTTTVSTSGFSYQFAMKCTSDAMIAFMTTKSESTEAAWEVILGGSGNSKSTISYGTGAEAIVTQIGSICNPSADLAPYWINLADDGVTMTVGSGATVGNNVFMTATVPTTLMTTKTLLVGFSGISTINEFRTYDSNCEYEHYQERTCNDYCCPVNCQVSDWNQWSSCSANCGGGTKQRTRDILTYDSCGGTVCPSLTDYDNCNTQACITCDVSDWSDWTECSESCGPNGMQKRTRSIQMVGGYDSECPTNTEDSRSCNTDVCCPVDCQVSDWLSSSVPAQTTYHLSSSNGAYNTYLPKQISNGNFVYTFQAMCYGDLSIVFSASASSTPATAIEVIFGGQSNTVSSIRFGVGSSDLNESVTVQANVCDPSSLNDYWVQKQGNTISAGTGAYDNEVTKKFLMSATVSPIANNKLFVGFAAGYDDTLVMVAPATVSDNDGWGACSEPCGGGVQYRYRNVDQYDSCGGAACPSLSESRDCNTQACSPTCKYSSWSEWSECSASCGEGVQTRIRSVEITPGAKCPDSTSQSRSCNLGCCPVDCVLSEWSSFSACDTICGGGQKTRTRTVLTPSSCGGLGCGKTSDVDVCNTQSCKPTCKDEVWGEWSSCSKTCGGGIRSRERNLDSQDGDDDYDGAECPTNDYQEEDCNTQSCPIDCVVSSWSSWSDCTVSCGGGTQMQSRTIVTQPQFGGKACPTLMHNYQLCNTQDCPTHCQVGVWGNWSTCDKPCQDSNGPGYMYRLRDIGQVATASVYLQSDCDDQRDMNLGKVVIGSHNFTLGTFDANMVHVFHFDIAGNVSEAHSAIGEENNLLTLVAANPAVGTTVIAVHLGGSGGMTQLSDHDRNAILKSGGSQVHTPDTESEQQQIASAQTQGWTYLLIIDQGNVAVEERRDGCGWYSFTGDLQISLAAPNGTCPQSARNENSCNTQYCPVPCAVSEWSDWDTCSTLCGGGVQSQTREILREAAYGGQACPETSHTQSCNNQPCPVPCQVSDWSDWSSCSKTCGGGVSKAYRNITRAAQYGGYACPSDTEKEVACNTNPCPTQPPTTPPCSGSYCEPTPTPTAPPPCVNDKPTFEVEPSQGAYKRFDGTKLKSTEFSIKIEIKGCRGASIAFMTQQGESADSNAYEVVLGSYDGTQGSIHSGTGGTALATKVAYNFLSQPCDSFVPYWITLKEGVMKVGAGTSFDHNKLMSANVPKIVGDGCDCLFVGFAADDVKITYRYAAPMKSCSGDACGSGGDHDDDHDGDDDREDDEHDGEHHSENEREDDHDNDEENERNGRGNSTQAPTSRPTTRPPTQAPTTRPPTQAPTTRPPTQAPTTRPPTQAPTQEPTEQPTFVEVGSEEDEDEVHGVYASAATLAELKAKTQSKSK